MLNKFIGVNYKQYQFLLDNKDKEEIHLYGSSEAAKTWSLVQYFTFEKLLKEKQIKFVCVKKYRASVKFAIYQFWKERLIEWGIPCTYHDSDLIITFPNGNKVYCIGLDKPEKIKGRFCNYVWINEAIELSQRQYLQCRLWARNKNINGKNQIYCDYNPEDITSFLKPLTENPPPNMAIGNFTYHDNAFLTPERRHHLEELEHQDRAYWLIYGKGQWAILTGIIYQEGLNWDIVSDEEFERDFADTEYGLDFGYNVPTALVELNFSKTIPQNCPEEHKNKQHIYERELIYQTHLDCNQLIEKMKQVIPPEYRHRTIWADSEDPSDIEIIRKAGFSGIKPALKPKDSVVAGIKRVKECFIHLSESSLNLQEEKRRYKWKVDKYDRPLDEPLKENNHGQDAERYVIFSRQYSPEAINKEEFAESIKELKESMGIQENIEEDEFSMRNWQK